jgi:hypothetical protein
MAGVTKLTRKRLGELLIEEGLLKEDQLQNALRIQKSDGALLGEVLVKLNYVTEHDIAMAIAKQFGLPYIDASRYVINKDVFNIVPVDYMYKHQFIILDKFPKALIVAVGGMLDLDVLQELERRSGTEVFVYVSTAKQVVDALKKYCPMPSAT